MFRTFIELIRDIVVTGSKQAATTYCEEQIHENIQKLKKSNSEDNQKRADKE